MTQGAFGPTSNHAPGGGSPGVGKWVKRGLLVGLVGLLVVVQWPLLKGVVYSIAPPAPASPEDLPAWREGYSAALEEAQRTGKPVLIDFTATWCPPCRVMEADVWPDERVREAIEERVIPVQLDVDDPSSAAAVRRYGIQYIPTIVLVDGQGGEIARGGFLSAGQMVDFVRQHAPEAAEASAEPGN